MKNWRISRNERTGRQKSSKNTMRKRMTKRGG